jgi:hypothetical protein
MFNLIIMQDEKTYLFFILFKPPTFVVLIALDSVLINVYLMILEVARILNHHDATIIQGIMKMAQYKF